MIVKAAGHKTFDGAADGMLPTLISCSKPVGSSVSRLLILSFMRPSGTDITPAFFQYGRKKKLTDAPSCLFLALRIYLTSAVPHEHSCLSYSSPDRSRRKEPSTAKKVYLERIPDLPGPGPHCSVCSPPSARRIDSKAKCKRSKQHSTLAP